MIGSLKTATALCALWAAVLPIAPSAAAAVPSSTAALKTAVADDVTLAQAARRAWPGYPSAGYGTGQVEQSPDTIGSLGYDGRGHSYNRFSGQVYQSCVEDLGYGRVRPCDAGSH
jgi:hypothetical protein